MAGKNTFKEQVEKYYKEYSKLSALSLDARVSKLDELYKKKADLEAELTDTNCAIILIEGTQDVLEFKLKKDKLAMALLDDLRESGDITYDNLIAPYNDFARHYIGNYLLRLKEAKLIQIKHDAESHIDTISVTETGKTFGYPKSK